jgi:ABC-type nitrate/sulfonate/bicarbonate transport system substrate-binding protein
MKKKLRILVTTITSLLVVLSLTSCGKSQSTSTETDGSKKLFTIRMVTQTSFNELNIADELGYFKEQGIKIQYTGVLKPGITEYQLIAQGINDAFVGGHPPNVAQARLAGIKVTAVAPGMVDNPKYPHVRYLVKNDSSIKTLDDINGKKVSISGVAGCTDGYIKYYLKQKGKTENIKWVTLPNPGQQEQSLVQGLVDVTTSHPPYAGLAVAAGGVREIGTSWDILHSPGAGLSVRGFSDEFIKEHPDVVKGFTEALYKAHVYINSHPKESKEIIAKWLKLKPDDLSVFWYDEDKTINPEYINKWFDISQSIGLWKKGDIKPTDIYTNAYAPK